MVSAETKRSLQLLNLHGFGPPSETSAEIDSDGDVSESEASDEDNNQESSASGSSSSSKSEDWENMASSESAADSNDNIDLTESTKERTTEQILTILHASSLDSATEPTDLNNEKVYILQKTKINHAKLSELIGSACTRDTAACFPLGFFELGMAEYDLGSQTEDLKNKMSSKSGPE